MKDVEVMLDKVRQVAIGQGEDYASKRLSDFLYFSRTYKFKIL